MSDETMPSRDLRERIAALAERWAIIPAWKVAKGNDSEAEDLAGKWGAGLAGEIWAQVVKPELDQRDAERDRLREALALIGTRCEIHTGSKTCVDNARRSRDAVNRLAFGWCNGCIARTALAQPAVSEET